MWSPSVSTVVSVLFRFSRPSQVESSWASAGKKTNERRDSSLGSAVVLQNKTSPEKRRCLSTVITLHQEPWHCGASRGIIVSSTLTNHGPDPAPLSLSSLWNQHNKDPTGRCKTTEPQNFFLSLSRSLSHTQTSKCCISQGQMDSKPYILFLFTTASMIRTEKIAARTSG